MDWATERYVRVYVRDTADWLLLPWQSRALWPLLLRKADRRGVIDLGKHGRRAVSALVGVPEEVAAAGVEGLLADGCLVEDGNSLVIPNFHAAQTTRSADVIRKEQQRHRESPGVTSRHPASPDVTPSHPESPRVTLAVLSGAVLSGAKEEEPSTAGATAPAPPSAKKTRTKKQRDPSPAALRIRDEIARLSGATYPPATLDALEARLSSGDMTEDDALALVRGLARDEFWNGEKVRLDPATLFRPGKYASLLAKVRAGPQSQPSPYRYIDPETL